MPVVGYTDLQIYNNTNNSSKDDITNNIFIVIIFLFVSYTLFKCFYFFYLKKKNNITDIDVQKYLNELETEKEQQINFECPICLETLDDDENLHIIQCNHAYHKECLEKWIQTSVKNRYYKCPLCNIEYLLAK